MRTRWLWLSALVVLSHCTGKSPEIDGIDWKIWKDDRQGCRNQRLQFLSPLSAQKDRLKSLGEMDIVELLGKPDQNELYKRNQKFYTYFFTPAPGCLPGRQAGGEKEPDSKRLIIRFNAIGLAKEVSIE